MEKIPHNKYGIATLISLKGQEKAKANQRDQKCPRQQNQAQASKEAKAWEMKTTRAARTDKNFKGLIRPLWSL